MPPLEPHLRRLVSKARRIPSRLSGAPEYVKRFTRALVADPVETLRSVPESVSGHLFDIAVDYSVEEEYGPAFHKMLGLPWPCAEFTHFQRVWSEIERILATQGLSFGRWSYGEYSDADPALGAVTWCAVRHLRPEKVIETGVARGVTSRIVLEAMALNGSGHLWSVDLPHPLRPELHHETAAAIPHADRDRWTYVRGSSRRQLPPLVSRLENVDMFIHDSLHTARNMRFELRTVWPAMDQGSLALVDDVDNQAFRDFVRESGRPSSMVMRSADGPWMFGALRKDKKGGSPGRFGPHASRAISTARPRPDSDGPQPSDGKRN